MKKIISTLMAYIMVLFMMPNIVFAQNYRTVLETDLGYEVKQTQISDEEYGAYAIEESNVISDSNCGYSIVYENVWTEDWWYTRFSTSESQYIIDINGNKVDIKGNYDEIGCFKGSKPCGVDNYCGVNLVKKEKDSENYEINKFGYYDIDDGFMIECKYDNYIERFAEDVFLVEVDYEYKFVDRNGNEIVDYQSNSEVHEEKTYNGNMSESFNVVYLYSDYYLIENTENHLYGIINGNDEIILPIEYQKIVCSRNEKDDGYLWTVKNDKWNLVKIGTVSYPNNAIVLTIDEKEVSVFGELIYNDASPKIVEERTMLPIRIVAESLGADIEWNGEIKKVTIKSNDINISLIVGDNFATVNDEKIELDVSSFIENGRTYLPVRFVAENLGANVDWDGEKRQVIITK